MKATILLKIIALLESELEAGVSYIAQETQIPTSTVQKYLINDPVFKQMDNKKWRLTRNINIDINQYVKVGWPLAPGETEPEPEIQEIMNDPQTHVMKALEAANYYEEIAKLAIERNRYLKNLIKGMIG